MRNKEEGEKKKTRLYFLLSLSLFVKAQTEKGFDWWKCSRVLKSVKNRLTLLLLCISLETLST